MNFRLRGRRPRDEFERRRILTETNKSGGFNSMKVLGIGESIIDNLILVNNITEKRILKSEIHVGGPVLSALIVLSRLNMDTTLVTSLGRDSDAKIIKKTLKHENIRLHHKIQKKTKINTIVVPKDTGQREKIRGNTIHLDIRNLDRKFVRQFDMIIIDRHEKTAFYEIMDKKKPQTKVIIDPSVEISKFTLDMIKYADYPILPIESLAKVDSKDLLRSIKKLYNGKELIITAGRLGSIIYDGKTLRHIQAFDVKAIDTVGAGDVYRGAFAYGIIKGWDIIKSATFGNFVGGLQCTKLGNAAAIPTKSEMEIFDMMYRKKNTDLSGIRSYFSQIVI